MKELHDMVKVDPEPIATLVCWFLSRLAYPLVYILLRGRKKGEERREFSLNEHVVVF